ncbi:MULTISPECIES: hypothetical protein [unclassified Paenibacillus]|uniref:Competence protein CoiA-like family protein n=2 Tax=Bacillati TaxID=1783272 RepID=A0ABW3QHF0_9BACL|nr:MULTISPECIES: hypothetical protein [unclassified Paenibacillus]MCM3130612.1 hypothetical protein [Paenibacillus sp. MER 78]SDX74491.1 hypothetical protein SAMN05518848_11359 [Paenibacillus sp. PDC88]SFS89836.1 hypothetical protein SAMN04488601_106179 [Paenibacillus sp. 453mf]
MQWARYGYEKKQISAEYYREAKHGEVTCRFCEGKMAYVSTGNRKPHFRVVDRKTHTCKYFGNEIEKIVESSSEVVQMNRKNNENPVFTLNIESAKQSNEKTLQSIASDSFLTSLDLMRSSKGNSLYKFIHDLHAMFLKNEYDKVLQFRFIVAEGGTAQKIKAEELVPSYKQIIDMHTKGKLTSRKRFIVGTILSSKETIKRNVEVTLRGEKSSDGSYINHKIIIMKYVLDQQNLDVTDFIKGNTIVVYAKLKLSDTKREVISFVSSKDDFDFGRYTSLDGDWLDSQDKKIVDDFFYLCNIKHVVPDHAMTKQYFYHEDLLLKPDWVLFIRNKTIVIDYVVSQKDFISNKSEPRGDYFINRTDYHYMKVLKEDIEDNFYGLKKKLHEIIPNLQLNLYES